ncbi:MAG: hypothetical protein ACK5XN_18860 [Bacteroidota bacterium]
MTLAQQLKSMSLPGTPAYRAAEAMDAAENALMSWRGTGCPECNGDCHSANPPVALCIMQVTQIALDKLRGEA